MGNFKTGNTNMKSISLSSSKYIILHNNLKFHWVKHLKKQKEKKKKKKRLGRLVYKIIY